MTLKPHLMQKASLESLREDYKKNTLNENDLGKDPFSQFETWFDEATAAKIHEPNAMNLSTVSKEGRPSARIVLLKGFNTNGFIFYTNYESKKGLQILAHPFGALTFYWPELERQVRIEGKIARTGREASTAYFQSRPRGSQIGAIVSPQSQTIPGRELLEERWAEYEADDRPVFEKPDNWGGFQLTPDLIEFWQGRSSRLHDRLEYKLKDGGEWVINRLAP